jgi:cytochrome c oxidase subunit 2
MIRGLVILLVFLILASCTGEQSAFSGYSASAARVVRLTWILFAGGALLLALVMGLTWLALFGRPEWRSRLRGENTVVWLGIWMPIAVLSALLLYGFGLLRLEAAPASDAVATRIRVVGEQWWWRVIYEHPDGSITESANELRFPVGQPVELVLTSADVIHSFWLPAYGGKVDMIPGRTNHLRFLPEQAAVVRGQCAEYCGGAHALMAFYAVAMPAEEYSEWLARERADASNGGAGEHTFLTNGCGGCHRVRGTPAVGTIGPDLTHIGGRLSAGAGIVSADHAGFSRWLREHQSIKPENLMPPYDILSETEVAELANYLVELK